MLDALIEDLVYLGSLMVKGFLFSFAALFGFAAVLALVYWSFGDDAMHYILNLLTLGNCK